MYQTCCLLCPLLSWRVIFFISRNVVYFLLKILFFFPFLAWPCIMNSILLNISINLNILYFIISFWRWSSWGNNRCLLCLSILTHRELTLCGYFYFLFECIWSAELLLLFIQVVLNLQILFTFFWITLKCRFHKCILSMSGFHLLAPTRRELAPTAVSSLFSASLPCNSLWTSCQICISCLALFSRVHTVVSRVWHSFIVLYSFCILLQ